MAKTNYCKRFILNDDNEAIQEGLYEMSKDISAIMNKYSRNDYPLLLAALKLVLPHIEDKCTAGGLKLSEEFTKAINCVSTTKEVKR